MVQELPSASQALQWIPLDQLVPHELNANVMAPELLAKLKENIARTRRYPPLLVRKLPTGLYQVIDGAHRLIILPELGETEASCLVWDVNDEETLILLATINRLHGEDVPAYRAALILELQHHKSLADLARLLPETEAELSATLQAMDLDVDALVAQLTKEAERGAAQRPQLFTFLVDPADAERVEDAISRATAELAGSNRKGRALVILADAYLGGDA